MQRPTRSTNLLPLSLFVLLLFLLAPLAPAQHQHDHILDSVPTDSFGGILTISTVSLAINTVSAALTTATATATPTPTILAFTSANLNATTTISSSLSANTTAAFVPPARYAAGCLALNTTLYCYGGQLSSSITTNALYSLDLSLNFSPTNASWSDRTSDGLLSSLPAVSYAAIFPSPDGVSFYIYGGGSSTGRVTNDLMLYDPTARAWSNASGLFGEPQSYRRESSVVVSPAGRAWIWGGVSDVWTGDNSTLYYNTFSILDMTNRQWEVPHVLQTSTPLLPRIGHTSTLLANGLMIVLGGLVAPGNDTLGTGNSSLSAPSMSNVLVFNTQSLSWTNVTAGGVVPSPRRGHSALLAGDGKSIIVFGGGDPITNITYNDVYVLDTSIHVWSKPPTSGTLPAAREDHSAIFYKNQMLVLFGSANNTTLNNIFVLDTLQWNWSQSFLAQGVTQGLTQGLTLSPTIAASSDAASATMSAIPPALASTPSPPPSDFLKPLGGPVGVAGICAGGVAAISLAAFLLVRKPWRNTTPTLIYLPNSGYAHTSDPDATPLNGTMRSTFSRAAYLLPGTVAQAESQQLRPDVQAPEDEIEVQEMQNLFYKRHAVTTSSRPPLPDFVALEEEQKAEQAQAQENSQGPSLNAPPPPPLPPPHLVVDNTSSNPASSSMLDSVITNPPTPDPRLRLQEGVWSKEDEDEDEEVVIGGGSRPQSSSSWWQSNPLRRDGSKAERKSAEERESLV